MPPPETLTIRMSSRGRVVLPKPIRDRMGLGEGTDVAVSIHGKDVILRKIHPYAWRRWEGRLKGAPLLEDLAAERRRERKKTR